MMKRLIASLTLLLLSGCILVEDFSAKWDASKPDECLTAIAKPLYYADFRRDPEGKDMDQLAHAFTLGKYHFLMLKKNANDKGGRMYRFGVENGIFQRYRLDPVMRDAFEIEYPKSSVNFKYDTVQLENLDTDVMKLLEEISNRPEFWEIEDQALYNTMRNPACRFEDRDLKALEEAEKPKNKKKN